MNPVLEKLMQGIQGVLPSELANDVKSNLEAVVKSNFEKLDLVTREQFEIQEKILERTRSRVTELERELQEIEARLNKHLDNE